MTYFEKSSEFWGNFHNSYVALDDELQGLFRAASSLYSLAIVTAERSADPSERALALRALGISRIEEICEEDRLSAQDWADPEGVPQRERARRDAHAR